MNEGQMEVTIGREERKWGKAGEGGRESKMEN